jgi:hypothetical protein
MKEIEPMEVVQNDEAEDIGQDLMGAAGGQVDDEQYQEDDAAASAGVLFEHGISDLDNYIGPPQHFEKHKKARREAIKRYKSGNYNMRQDTIEKYGLKAFH